MKQKGYNSIGYREKVHRRINVFSLCELSNSLKYVLGLLILFVIVIPNNSSAQTKNPPVSLNKTNPHYFTFRGQPTVLITSAEHYGPVLNPDFDYITYLDVLQVNGFNLTRIFLGDYVSAPGFFDYPVDEPLTPAPGRLLTPWARSPVPGYANGGNKFDLSTWDENYFKRLRDFIAEAGKRGIVVEVTFFCPYYANGLSPYCSDNNIQGLTSTTNALSNTALVAVQEALVEKVVSELRDFDNIYYEPCNEPYHGGGPRD